MSLFEGVEAAIVESDDLSHSECGRLADLFIHYGGTRLDLKHLKAGNLVFTGPNSLVFKSKTVESMKELLKFYSVDWISDSIKAGKQLELGDYEILTEPNENIFLKEHHSEDEYFFDLMECQRETPLKSPYNQDLVDYLSKIEEARYVSGDSRSQQSYRRAIALIKAYPKRIESGAEAQKMRGIGGKIAYMIDEFVRTGRIEYAEQLVNDEKLLVLKTFCKIHGVGPVTANKWYDEGLRSIEDIQSKHLTTQQRLGLKYFVDFNTPMTRAQVENIAKLIEEQVNITLGKSANWHVHITGGYSRGKELSNDLDLIIYPEERGESRGQLKHLIDALEAKGFIKEIIMFHAYDPNDHDASKKPEQDHYDKVKACSGPLLMIVVFLRFQSSKRSNIQESRFITS